MALTLPPPPKTRSIWGLLVTLLLVGWTGYLLATYERKPALPKTVATTPAPAPPGPSFVEIDLRGPQYEEGRYEGYQRGKEAKLQKQTLPAEQVLAFAAAELAQGKTLDAAQTEDFVAGYKSGYKQAMAAAK